MTNVYKFEVVVVDYDDLGESNIARLIEGLNTPYTVLSYVTDAQKVWIDNPDTVGRRQLVEQKIPELFSTWQPISTAPRDGTRILFFYGARKAVFTAWYEKEYEYTLPNYIVDNEIQDIPVYSYWHLQLPSENDDIYFEEENPTNCYWQPLPELPI